MQEDQNATQKDLSTDATHQQEQSDPQLTELRGFIKKEEELEPTLADGTKSPDKAKQEHKEQKNAEE